MPRKFSGLVSQSQSHIKRDILTPKLSSLTPCPGLHVYKSRSPPRHSLALKPVLTGTDMPGTGTVKRFHTEILSKDRRNLVSASGRSTTSSCVAPSFQPPEHESRLEATDPRRLYTSGTGAEDPSQDPFEDTVPSPQAQKEHIKARSTPYGPILEVNQADKVPVEKSLPSENAILSPHAIQIDLVEPRATWNCLPQTQDFNEYSHEQALQPRGSIADGLASMVERGWVGGDTFGQNHSDDEIVSHTMFHISDTRLDSRSDSLSEMPRSKKVPSYSGSLSVSTAETRSESQHSIGQDTPPRVKQKEPRTFLNRGSQKRRQRQTKCSPSVDITQRSGSDSGVRYLKNELANPTGKRRAWTLHHPGRSTSTHSQTQRQVLPTIGPSHARDHRSSEQDRHSMKSQPSREGSTPKSGFDLTMLGDEELRQNSAALSKMPGSRRSSSNTKESTRSVSRSASFFKKFPWYKVALIDKRPVVQDVSKGRCGNDRTSRSTRAAQHDPISNQSELPRDFSKPHALVECIQEQDGNAPKIKTPTDQGPIDRKTEDSVTSSYNKTCSQPSLQLMTSPPEIQRVPEHSRDLHGPSSTIAEERLPEYSHQVIKDVIGHAQSPTRTSSSGTQPRLSSHSGSIDASFESPTPGDVLQSLQPQWPEEKEHSRMQSYNSSCAHATKLPANSRPKQRSSDSGTARPEQESAAAPNHSHQLRSKVVNMFPKRVGTWTDSMPANVHKSDQNGPARQEVKERGKGIKKIQVTVTFDGAEELVIEATMKRRDEQEELWRTMA